MEAICKPDYDQRVAAKECAEKLHEKRKKEREEAQSARRRAEEKGKKWRINAKDTISSEEEEAEREIQVPEVGYHDIYSVWFFGQLKGVVREMIRTRFATDLGNIMHVFMDVEPKKIADGIHDLMVYGHPCRLYKWLAQGCHLGLVVLADDQLGNDAAAVYQESSTWSWVVGEDFKARLPKGEEYWRLSV